MKAWFAKLKISSALDSGQEPAAKGMQSKSLSAELRGFEQDMAELDRALKQTVPTPDTLPSLHNSIMGAVRMAARPAAESGRELTLLRWLPASIVAGLLVIVAWHVARVPDRLPLQDAQSLVVATTALEMGRQVAQSVPSAVVTPLSDELEKVNRDLNNTAEFLLASLP